MPQNKLFVPAQQSFRCVLRGRTVVDKTKQFSNETINEWSSIGPFMECHFPLIWAFLHWWNLCVVCCVESVVLCCVVYVYIYFFSLSIFLLLLLLFCLRFAVFRRENDYGQLVLKIQWDAHSSIRPFCYLFCLLVNHRLALLAKPICVHYFEHSR